MKTDPEEIIPLTEEQAKRIDDICASQGEMTDYVRRYIDAYRKKNDETKTSKGS
jgi:hypothetical protein